MSVDAVIAELSAGAADYLLLLALLTACGASLWVAKRIWMPFSRELWK